MKKIIGLCLVVMSLVACGNQNTLWKNGVIKYQMVGLSDFQEERVRQAMDTWETMTDEVIVFHKSDDPDAVRIMRDDTNYASIGYNSQDDNYLLLLDFDQATIQHEIGHTIGLDHEHQRLDRDLYISVDMDQVPDGWYSEYRLKMPKFYDYRGYPYDYGSIMHYADDSVITTPEDIGGRSISPVDVRKVVDMYESLAEVEEQHLDRISR